MIDAVAVKETVKLEAAGRAVGAALKGDLYAGGNLAGTEQAWSVSGRIVDWTGAGIAGATVTAGGAQPEGPSKADAMGYAGAFMSDEWGRLNPGAYFVLMSTRVFSYNEIPIPNSNDPENPYLFSSYTW